MEVIENEFDAKKPEEATEWLTDASATPALSSSGMQCNTAGEPEMPRAPSVSHQADGGRRGMHLANSGATVARLPHVVAGTRPAGVREPLALHRTWLVTWVGCALAAALWIGAAPLGDPDLPLHLAVGEWIARHHSVPFTEPFAWTRSRGGCCQRRPRCSRR